MRIAPRGIAIRRIAVGRRYLDRASSAGYVEEVPARRCVLVQLLSAAE